MFSPTLVASSACLRISSMFSTTEKASRFLETADTSMPVTWTEVLTIHRCSVFGLIMNYINRFTHAHIGCEALVLQICLYCPCLLLQFLDLVLIYLGVFMLCLASDILFVHL